MSTAGLMKIGIGRETTAGTEADQGNIIGFEVDSFDSGERAMKENKEVIVGEIEKNSGAAVVAQYSEPSFGGYCNAEQVPLLLYAFLGDNTTSADTPETGVTKHAVSALVSNTPPSLSIVYIENAVTQSILNFRVQAVTIEAVQQGRVKFTCSGKGLYPVTSTRTISYDAVTDFTAKHAVVKLDATEVPFQRFKVEFARNVEVIPQLNSLAPRDFKSGPIDFKGDGDITFDNNTYRDGWANNTTYALQFLLQNDSNIGATSTPAKIQIDLTKADINEFTTDRSLDNQTTSSFTFQGHKLRTETDMVTAEIFNNVTAY